jgi:hypothetical protein
VSNSVTKCLKLPRKSRKSGKFPRKSRKSPKKLFSKSKKSNRRIHSQIQDRTPTSRDIDEFQNHREKLSKFKNRELPSGSVYFLNIFEHKFFLVNHHETDFSLVFHPLRARTSTPPDTQPPSCEGKENVLKKSKSQSRNVKVKIKIIATSEDGHSLSLTSENCNYVLKSMVQTPAQAPLEDLGDPTTGCRPKKVKYGGYLKQNSRENAGITTTKIKTITSELPDGASSKVTKMLRKTPQSEKKNDRSSGNAVGTKSAPQPKTTNKKPKTTNKKERENSKPKSGVTINNVFFYHYKVQYQYKIYMNLTLTLRTRPSESKQIGRVQPTSTSTSRLPSGGALRATLRLTLTPNNNNVYQFTYKLQYQYKFHMTLTLTLRTLPSESKQIGRVQPTSTSTSRLPSGGALRSTLRLTLTPKNNSVYQFTYNLQYQYKFYMTWTLTLRTLPSESKQKGRVQPTSTSRLTSGKALRSTLRLTLTPNNNSVYQFTYKLQYQYRVQPTSTSTSRLPSGRALRSTLRLTLTPKHNSVYQFTYKLQYQYKFYMTLTLTLRTLPSESKQIGRVQPTSTSTSRLTSGKALRSTLRLTLTPNNNNVYQFTYKLQYQYKFYMTLTLTLRTRPSESIQIGRVQPTSTSTSRLTSGKAL